MLTTRHAHPTAPLARTAPFVALLLLLAGPAAARESRLHPTGKPQDYQRVSQAMLALAPGDTLTLGRGVFDWSANLADSALVRQQPGGMPVVRPGLVIRGVLSPSGAPETILRGATDPSGRPVRPTRGTNAAFRNAPNGDRVTIEDLVFENFENAIVLVQADTLVTATPVDVLREGTRGWTLQRLTIRGGPFGIMANGHHQGLAIRDCDIAVTLPPRPQRGTGGREGSFAVAVRPYPPVYPGLPVDVTIERNRATGPPRQGETEIFGGLILTGKGGRIIDNRVTGWGIGLVVEGDSLEVSDNTIEDCRIGIVAWATERLGTGTTRAVITDNAITRTTRQAEGFLSDFTGTALFLAGIQDSRVERNRFKNNAGPDIVFGAMRGTKSSTGNVLTGNGGTVVLTEASRENNEISGSEVRVVGNRPNPVIGRGDSLGVGSGGR